LVNVVRKVYIWTSVFSDDRSAGEKVVSACYRMMEEGENYDDYHYLSILNEQKSIFRLIFKLRLACFGVKVTFACS